MAALDTIKIGSPLMGYLAKAREMEEYMRLAYKRHQEEIDLESNHLDFMETCLQIMSIQKAVLKRKVYSPENTKKAKEAMILTSLNSITKIQQHETSKDRAPKKSLTKRLTKVSQLLNGEKAYESPSSMKNYLSDEGIDRWKRLKYFANALNDKTAFSRNRKSGSISSRDYYLVNHGGHKNKHFPLISRNTSP